MSEIEFIESIACKFPYQDAVLALRLAETACSISPNAAFAVLDEISRPPFGETADAAVFSSVVAYCESQILHPLASPVISIVRKLGLREPVSVSEAIFVLRQIERFPGQYAALSIVYFASDDVAGLADNEYNRIRALWDAP